MSNIKENSNLPFNYINEVLRNVKFSFDDFFIQKYTDKNGKTRIVADITRNGILKILSHIPEYTLKTVNKEIKEVNGEVLFITEVEFKTGGRVTSGIGIASIKEIQKKGENVRQYHDAFTLAETRAMKRAVETGLGTTIINEWAKRLFDKPNYKQDFNQNKQETQNKQEYKNEYKQRYQNEENKKM